MSDLRRTESVEGDLTDLPESTKLICLAIEPRISMFWGLSAVPHGSTTIVDLR
jgi:hypothetical protein